MQQNFPGSRHYIHAGCCWRIISHENAIQKELLGNAKCQKFNIVGSEELDNLELSKFIEVQNKEINYEMLIFITGQVMI